ncbi:MAG: hypothetical protein COA36_16265 [Desulfotalea sp.]|nr:MAG: hypothetical protein COA36_16265 [Desulfotalea sp.]
MKIMELIVTNSLDELENIRSFAHKACVDLARMVENDARISRVELGVNEVAVNIIKHANRGRKDVSFRIVLHVSLHQLNVEFFDSGNRFDPTAVSPPCLDGSRENGFGIFIVSKLFDKVVYLQNETGENHTILTLLL